MGSRSGSLLRNRRRLGVVFDCGKGAVGVMYGGQGDCVRGYLVCSRVCDSGECCVQGGVWSWLGGCARLLLGTLLVVGNGRVCSGASSFGCIFG